MDDMESGPSARADRGTRRGEDVQLSIIVPVGQGHDRWLGDALESVELQTFEPWELIVVWDREDEPPREIQEAYRFVRWIHTGAGHGAGYARNRGVEAARAPLLLFLDADDFLLPRAAEKMMDQQRQERAIVYGDYLGLAYLNKAQTKRAKSRIIWQTEDGLTLLRYKHLDYDPILAQKQPGPSARALYVWCSVTNLTPKAWHEEIGGFDESLPSWEDVDYFWRMAKAGKCFSRIAEPLWVYRLFSGQRRDFGHQHYRELYKLLAEKHRRIKIMGCSGCGGGAPRPLSRANPPARAGLRDEDLVWVEYRHPSRGEHPVIGPAGFDERLPNVQMIQGKDGRWHIHYGFHAGGERFAIHRADLAAGRRFFSPVKEGDDDQDRIEWSEVPGLPPGVAEELVNAGLQSRAKVEEIGLEGLMALPGIGPKRAEAIWRWLGHED